MPAPAPCPPQVGAQRGLSPLRARDVAGRGTSHIVGGSAANGAYRRAAADEGAVAYDLTREGYAGSSSSLIERRLARTLLSDPTAHACGGRKVTSSWVADTADDVVYSRDLDHVKAVQRTHAPDAAGKSSHEFDVADDYLDNVRRAPDRAAVRASRLRLR
jgi:hypothetical protein